MKRVLVVKMSSLGDEGLFELEECRQLTEAYLAYRSAAHQLSLQQQEGIVDAGRFQDLRKVVEAKWRQLFAPYPLPGESDDQEESG